MKKAALENGVVIVQVCFDSIIGIFELHKCETFAFSICLLEWDVYLVYDVSIVSDIIPENSKSFEPISDKKDIY